MCVWMGIAGAAEATLIAQFISVGYCFFTIRKLTLLHPRRKDLRLEIELSGKLMLLGLPMAFQNFDYCHWIYDCTAFD